MRSIAHTSLGIELTDNLKENEGFVIGKSTKRYTLWVYRYSEDHNTLCVSYVHNLSGDVNIVRYRYPDTYICESLKGTTFSFTSSKSKNQSPANKTPKTIEEYDSLPFGKYAGININSIKDCSYWCYFANLTSNTEYYDQETDSTIDFKPLYIKRAIETGAILINGKYYDPEYLNNRSTWYETYKSIYPKIENKEPFEFIAPKNDSKFWFGLPIYFKTEDTYSFYTYYGGGSYLVITDKKGNRKNKRTKGKTIVIEDYEVLKNSEGFQYINVNKFNIK